MGTESTNYRYWRAHGNCKAVVLRYLNVCLIAAFCMTAVYSQSNFEMRPISKMDISFGGTSDNRELIEQYRLIALDAIGANYSTQRLRDAIEALYATKKIDTISVSANLTSADTVELLFNIKRKTQAQKLTVIVGSVDGDTVTEQELLFKLNLLQPGSVITEQTLRNNADEILDYLRERGFYRSDVKYERQSLTDENEVGVTFRVAPNAQARVENFNIDIDGYIKQIPAGALKLSAGKLYSRDRLTSDMEKIREILGKDDFLAPELDEPRIVYDSDANTISISLSGKVGPKVEIKVDSEKEKVGSSTQTKLLPIKREGTLDYAAIVEGERRLENYYQEKGYFFANVTPVCSVTPQISDDDNHLIANETTFLCSFLGGEDLMGHSVLVKYGVDLDRRLRLTELRIRGTDKLGIEDVRTILESQEKNILGFIPVLGYGRGYTSETLLEDDRATIESLMHELGYRDAQVYVNQGVSLDGEDLIITFQVDEGIPTVVTDVAVTGNKAVATSALTAELPEITGLNYSRARIRNASRKLSEYYSKLGYYDARVTSSVVELDPGTAVSRHDVKIEFKVESEGKQVVIDRILVNGNEATKASAVDRALAFKPGDLLRSVDIYSSEQNLYASDAYSRVDIKPQPAGDLSDEKRLTDVIVNLEEQPPRLLSYGGGFSTDLGLSGFFDIRHVNLFGKLWQGGARVKVSQRQQLLQLDLINPRFIHDGEKRFAPLTLSAQYQRDSTVTRFFRSVFDKGTFGIVQRVDANGNPIDEFGNNTGNPTINRFGLTAETNRTLSRKSRSIVFLRYRFEDVRLFNIDSLLVKDLLLPDQRNRISGFGLTFVRDTRKNCSVKYSLLELIAKGEPSDKCQYNASDPTNGYFLTADYNVSVPALGANVGFQKFQASVNYFYTLPSLKNTTLAARGILGAGSVFSGGNRFNSALYPQLNGLLPISERFFGGGANTLRGFASDEAGPRAVIVPQGTFRDRNGDPITLDPFTIPFGGNGLAVVNLEARIPLSRSIRGVPFYDGGNVFRKAGDIFKAPTVAPNDIAGLNARAVWTHTVGLGLRIKTPIGGEFGIDYGYLLNPPKFLIPQTIGPPAVYRLKQGQLHFRFSQAF